MSDDETPEPEPPAIGEATPPPAAIPRWAQIMELLTGGLLRYRRAEDSSEIAGWE